MLIWSVNTNIYKHYVPSFEKILTEDCLTQQEKNLKKFNIYKQILVSYNLVLTNVQGKTMTIVLSLHCIQYKIQKSRTTFSYCAY